jgi:PASTA domain
MTSSGRVSEFTVPARESRPQGIATGREGNIWFTEALADKIVRLRPALLNTCVVPNLKGKTLAQAKRLLGRTDCRLGKVGERSPHRRTPVVVGQRPAAKSAHPRGTKVSVRLG